MNSWFNSGFDALDEYDKQEESRGGYNPDAPRTPKRFWMPDGSEKRLLFLDEEPFMFHEHNFQRDGHYRNWEICQVKNGLGDSCEHCDNENWSYLVGYFTVIDLTPYEFVSKRGENKGKTIRVEWGKRLYGAKAGSKRKPGVLHKLRRLQDRKGGLTGTIWLVSRDGDMSPNVGSDFDFDGRIERKEGQSWEEAIREWAESNNGVTEEQWEKNPWTPYDYSEIFNPEGSDPEESGAGAASKDDVPF